MDLVIPSSIDGIVVSEIQTAGCDFVKRIESVTVPSSVRCISGSCFRGAEKLALVEFEQGSQLGTLGSRAFEGCMALKEFSMPESLKVMEGPAFYGCVNMERLMFSDALEPFYYVSNALSGADKLQVEQRFNPAPYAENVEFIVSSASKNYTRLSRGLSCPKTARSSMRTPPRPLMACSMCPTR